MSLCFADFVVSDSVRHASALERYGVGGVYSLRRSPFSFSQNDYHLGNGEVRVRTQFSPGTGFCQATPDRLCTFCPPAA